MNYNVFTKSSFRARFIVSESELSEFTQPPIIPIYRVVVNKDSILTFPFYAIFILCVDRIPVTGILLIIHIK